MPDTTTLLTALLAAGEGGFVSGEELAKRLGVSRVSVWARLQKLQDEGLACEAVRGRGYRLKSAPAVLHPAVLGACLTLRHRGKTPPEIQVIFLPEVDSTNPSDGGRRARRRRSWFLRHGRRRDAGGWAGRGTARKAAGFT
jgi:biotin operon repressor BirA-like protein